MDYLCFKALQLVSLMGNTLAYVNVWPGFKLPSSLQTIEIPFYSFDDADPRETDVSEEDVLFETLSQELFPNLKEVLVPSRPTKGDGSEARSPLLRRLWQKRRAKLAEHPRFKNTVDLKVMDRGANGE